MAKLEASRLNGPAPLAVMFDGTGSTAASGVDVFRELTYEFDFGDDRGMVWEHSGQPRNVQKGGPLAAHVFDDPGTYTVRMRARAADGHYSDSVVTITVEDPDTVYAGTKTVCVSVSRTYSGCPDGAARETSLPRDNAGKRILLHRGESFGPIGIRRHEDNVTIGAYGTGEKPTVGRVAINVGRINTRFSNDVTIMDLNVTDGIVQSDSGSRYLFYRNTLTHPNGNNTIEVGGALDYHAERMHTIPFYYPREIFIVDNVLAGRATKGSRPFLGISGSGSHFVLMGNDVSRSEEHTVRFFALHKGFIAHNALRGISYSASPNEPAIRHVLKIHSGGLMPYADAWMKTRGKWATRYLVISDNVLGDPENNGSWTITVAPQNSDEGTVEGIEDVIIERNRFVRGPYTGAESWVVGRRITTRGNTRADGGVPNLSIGEPSVSLPPEWVGPYYRE